MKEENQTLTTPPIQTAKAAEYFIDLYDQNGYVLDEKKAIELASSGDLKSEIARQYRVLGVSALPQPEIDSLYDSFLDKAEVEKKNLLDTTTSLLESSSVLEERDSSSALDQSVMEISLDEDPVGPEKLFSDALNRVNMEVFSLNGEDAALILDKQLGFYGFKFSPSSANRKITITAPDGESKDFRLFTEAYRNLPGQTEEINQLAERRLSQMKDFLQSKSNATGMDNLSAIMSVATPETIIDEISRITSKYDDEATSDMNQTLSKFFEDYNINNYVDKGKLDLRKTAQGYQDARQMLATKSERFDTAVSEQLDASAERFNITKANVASILSGVLSKTGAYSKIDINDPVALDALDKAGLSAGDIPLDAIKINGRARSLNYLTSNILYDFDKVQAIRDGKITIEIGDPKSAGLLAPFVQKARNAAEAQKAFASKHAGNEFLRFTEEVGEIGMNFMESIAMSLYEIPVNHAYLYYDSLKSIGLSEEDAKSIVYGSTEVPVALYGSFRPEYLEKARNEALPKWNGDYLDSKGFHEVITRGTQDLAGSLVHTALFMIPEGLPIALTNTAINTYASDRMGFENLRREVEDKRKRGYVLTEEEMNIINMSDAKARSLSITKAATETALTSAFTGKFFKNYRKFAGLKPKIESLHGNIASFNKVYAKAVRNDIIGLASRYAGVSSRAIATEIPEEELIAFTNYASDIIFGTKKFDGQEAKRIFANTGISSVFTSAAMGKAAALGANRRARKMAVDIVASNLTLPQERSIMSQKAFADAELKAREDQMRIEGVDPSQDVYNTLLKNRSLDLADRINRIQEEKIKIAEQMPAAEKLEFLELMEAIDRTKKGMATASDLGQQKAVLDEIAKFKEKGRKILSKYPSELSYYFADQQTQSKFESNAITALSAEAEANGQEFVARPDDDVVLEKAASLYNQYLKESKDEEADQYYAFRSFGIVDIPDIKVEVTEEEKSKDIQELMSFMEGMNRGETSLADVILTDQEYVNLIKERSRFISDIDKVAYDDITKVLDDPNSTDEEKAEARRKGVELDKNYNFLNEGYKQQLAELKGRVFADQFKKSIEETGNVDEDRVRIDNIYARLKALDIGNIGTMLSKEEAKTIRIFKKTLFEGNRPQFGRMEAMLDGMEAVNQIYAKSGGKIDLSNIVGDDGTLTELGVAAVNNLLSKVYSKGLATKDVLARTLFRDREVGAPFIDLMNEAFRLSAEAENKSRAAYDNHLVQYKNDGGKDPMSLDNSYELFILGALKRRSKEIAPDGKNGEFSRMQSLILDELARRKKKADQNPEDEAVKLKYEEFNKIVEKLGVAEAKSYEDITSKASSFNVNAIERLSGIMPGKRAFDRINDFEGYIPFEYEEGSYIPLFMKKNGESYGDYFGISTSTAASLQNVTRPSRLPDDVDLNPEGFWDNAYNQYRGAEMDIMAKKAYETLDFIVNSPRFEQLFEGEAKQDLLNTFRGIKGAFERDVRSSTPRVLDPEKLPKEYLKKATNIVYGIASSVALARYSQPASQFYSAVAGSGVYLKNSIAKSYLGKRTAAFTVGAAKFYDGNTGRDKLTGELSISDNVKQFFRYKDPKLGNIYMKSRTGLRNSVLANLAVDANKKVPISYYASRLNLSDKKQEALRKAIGNQATVDQVLDFMMKANQFNLDLWLGYADRLAANATFEAAYLDHRISQGAKVGADLDVWWEGENKSPNLEAIRYADEIVAKTMRQTGQTSEANVYSSEASLATKNLMRIVFPFSKFIMNAKSDIMNNLNIVMDPNIPQSQKIIAENAIVGRGLEVLIYNAIKVAAGRMMVNGVISAFGFGLQGEEEDIEEYGGMTRLIAEELLPIVSKEEFDPMKLGISEATTWEQYNAILQAQAGFTEVDGIADEFKTYSKTFEDKFTTQGDYSVLGPTIQDLISTMTPVPIPDVADDLLAMTFNKIYGEDIATEFISKDLRNISTFLGQINFIAQKAGMTSIGLGQWAAINKSLNMAYNLEVVKFTDFGEITEHLSAPTDAMREKLVGATQLLVALRINAILNPVAPRADLDKLADKLERAIESNFSGGKKDEKMHEMKGNFIFPLEDEFFRKPIEEASNIAPE